MVGSAAIVETAGRALLDPISRISEFLFGLIMAMPCTCSLGVADAGRNDVRAMLIGALGCNIGWGIIDGVRYQMNNRASKGGGLLAFRAVRQAGDPQQARKRIAEALPEPPVKARLDDCTAVEAWPASSGHAAAISWCRRCLDSDGNLLPSEFGASVIPCAEGSFGVRAALDAIGEGLRRSNLRCLSAKTDTAPSRVAYRRSGRGRMRHSVLAAEGTRRVPHEASPRLHSRVGVGLAEAEAAGTASCVDLASGEDSLKLGVLAFQTKPIDVCAPFRIQQCPCSLRRASSSSRY